MIIIDSLSTPFIEISIVNSRISSEVVGSQMKTFVDGSALL